MLSEISLNNNTDWIDRQEYPFESHFFSVPVGRLHYVEDTGYGHR
jgi:hypothetical protein